MANIWAPLRAGSDILFLGGLIRTFSRTGKTFASMLSTTPTLQLFFGRFKDTEDLGGVFSGWDAKNQKYDRAAGFMMAVKRGKRWWLVTPQSIAATAKRAMGRGRSHALATLISRSAIRGVCTNS